MAGRPVRMVVMARRLHCDAVLCGRRIFTERFDRDVLAPWARRIERDFTRIADLLPWNIERAAIREAA